MHTDARCEGCEGRASPVLDFASSSALANSFSAALLLAADDGSSRRDIIYKQGCCNGVDAIIEIEEHDQHSNPNNPIGLFFEVVSISPLKPI